MAIVWRLRLTDFGLSCSLVGVPAIFSSSAGEIVSMVNSSRFIEHDAYTLFDKVMEHTNSWFLSGTRGPAVRAPFLVLC